MTSFPTGTARGRRCAAIVVAVAVAVAFSALSARQGFAATGFKFRPSGGSACGANVNRTTSGMPLATLDQYEDVDELTWAVINNSPASSTGLPDDRHILFDIATPTAASNTAPAGATFTLAFTMNLLSVLGSGGSKQYGLDDPLGSIYTDNTRTTLRAVPVRYPTHVYLEASVQGTLPAGLGTSSLPPNQLVRDHPRFTQARFRMFFDADGDPTSTGDRTLIAKLGTTAAPDPLTSTAGTSSTNVEIVDFIVNWDAATPGMFADTSGHELAIGPPDPTDPTLRQVSAAAQPTSEMDLSFRFECAVTGPCTKATATTLSFRLHTLSSHGAILSVPASTVVPAVVFCPPKKDVPVHFKGEISPTEFPYKVTVETRCAEALAGVCLREEIIRACVGGNCFDVPPGKIPGPTCVRCVVAVGAVAGLAIGALALALLKRRA
jgi:hypothetical protein